MHLRGDRGEFIRAKTTWFKGLPHSNEAEARGLKEAINWLGNSRFSSVSIKLNSKWLTTSLATNSMFDAILNGYKASHLNHHNFKIVSLEDKQIMLLIC